MEEAE
jgi:hypothetical protein